MTMSDVLPADEQYDQLCLGFDTECMRMKELIRVLVVDDHAVVRKALRSLLTSKYGIEVVGEAENGFDAVKAVREVKPHVTLMDLVMPGQNGIDATREIVDKDPGARVLILTSFSDEEQIRTAIKAGAVGYVLKDASPDELIHAIRGAHMGRISLPANMLRFVQSDVPIEDAKG